MLPDARWPTRGWRMSVFNCRLSVVVHCVSNFGLLCVCVVYLLAFMYSRFIRMLYIISCFVDLLIIIILRSSFCLVFKLSWRYLFIVVCDVLRFLFCYVYMFYVQSLFLFYLNCLSCCFVSSCVFVFTFDARLLFLLIMTMMVMMMKMKIFLSV